MARASSGPNIVGALGSSVAPSLGVLLSLTVSNTLCVTLKKQTTDKTVQDYLPVLCDVAIGYLGFMLSNTLDRPFISDEIWGFSIGMMAGGWGRAITRLLGITGILNPVVAGLSKANWR